MEKTNKEMRAKLKALDKKLQKEDVVRRKDIINGIDVVLSQGLLLPPPIE